MKKRLRRDNVILPKPKDMEQYIQKMLSALENADLSEYKDSMRPLIEKDIAETIGSLKKI